MIVGKDSLLEREVIYRRVLNKNWLNEVHVVEYQQFSTRDLDGRGGFSIL